MPPLELLSALNLANNIYAFIHMLRDKHFLLPFGFPFFYKRTGVAPLPSQLPDITQARRIIWGKAQVIQPDFHYSQPWPFQSRAEDGKVPRTAPLPTPREPGASSQRIPLGPPAVLLSLLGLSTAARKKLSAPCPLDLPTVGQMEPRD